MHKHHLVIQPHSKGSGYWKEIWRYRELFYFLAWRDILVKYKQTAIGIAWSIIRPLLTLVAFTIVFGILAKFPDQGVPYPLLVYSALLPWQFFANAFSESSNSLVGNANILTKVFFPRMIIPVSTVVVALLDFLISFVLLILLMLWYGFQPGWQIITVPIFLLQAALTSIGLGLLIGAMNVKYRDFRYIVPFIVQVGLYITPVGFSSKIVPEKWQFLYSLNPLVGVIDGFRWAILGGDNHIYLPGFILSVAISLTALLTGIWYFRKSEKSFVDNI
jgi:lipopolysaccharide transport system permease protein